MEVAKWPQRFRCGNTKMREYQHFQVASFNGAAFSRLRKVLLFWLLGSVTPTLLPSHVV